MPESNNSTSHNPQAKRAKLILFLTIFVAMLGLSVLFPIVGPLSRSLNLTETQVGMFATAYSLMQFIFSPIWGHKSEQQGRKPILLLGLFGFAISFILFGLVATLGQRGIITGSALFGLLLLSRLIGGMLSSASLPTAQAMMADLSDETERTSNMALIGAAFGLGVIFGPALGGLLSGFGLLVPVYFSGGLGLAISVIAFFVLPETRAKGSNQTPKGARRALLNRSTIWIFLSASALSTLASVGLEQTFSFYVQDLWQLSDQQTPSKVAGLLTIFGLVAVAVQGGLIRNLGKKVSPERLIAAGLLIMGSGMFILPLMQNYWALAFALVLVAGGSATLSPSLSSALSLSVGPDKQGIIAGMNSSALALGRMTGPLLGTGLYQYVSHSAPYYLSGSVLIGLLVWVLSSQVGKRILGKQQAEA